MNILNSLEKRLIKLEKYLLESKTDQEKLLNFLGQEYYDKYNNIKNKIKDPEYKDIYKLIKKDPEEVVNFIDNFQSKSDKRNLEKEGAKLLYNKDGWKVYKITTYEAAVIYGRNTKWCITGNYPGHEERGQHYFDSYIHNYDLDGGYYFYIKSNDEKYCILKQTNKRIQSIWDIKDNKISAEDLPDDFPLIPSIYDPGYETAKEFVFSKDIREVMAAVKYTKDVVNITDEDGFTPLNMAIYRGDKEIVKLLLDNGARLDVYESMYGRTPLCYACEKSGPSIVKLLLDAGADINTPCTADNYFYTPLHIAVDEDDFDLVKLLLERGADPNKKDHIGLTPLYMAVDKEDIDMIEILIEHGADAFIKTDFNTTTLDITDNPTILKILNPDYIDDED